MDVKKFPMLIVGVVVALVLAGVVLPVFAETTSAETTFKNEGIYYMENPTNSVSVKFLGGTDWEINGVPLEYTPSGTTNIIVTNSIFVRNNGQVRGAISSTWASADLTISGGAISGTAVSGDSTTTVNYSYDYVYIATNDISPFIMTARTISPYIKSDSELIGFGLTSVKDSDGNNQYVTFNVNVTDLTPTVTCLVGAVTVSDVTINTEAVKNYDDLYKFISVSFNATWGEYVTPCTYSVLIAPSEVTAEKTVHPDGALATLLNILPLLAIAGLVTGAVVWFVSRKG